jgi:hypothetical protein
LLGLDVFIDEFVWLTVPVERVLTKVQIAAAEGIRMMQTGKIIIRKDINLMIR